jgi:hypothetical protein
MLILHFTFQPNRSLGTFYIARHSIPPSFLIEFPMLGSTTSGHNSRRWENICGHSKSSHYPCFVGKIPSLISWVQHSNPTLWTTVEFFRSSPAQLPKLSLYTYQFPRHTSHFHISPSQRENLKYVTSPKIFKIWRFFTGKGSKTYNYATVTRKLAWTQSNLWLSCSAKMSSWQWAERPSN